MKGDRGKDWEEERLRVRVDWEERKWGEGAEWDENRGSMGQIWKRVRGGLIIKAKEGTLSEQQHVTFAW